MIQLIKPMKLSNITGQLFAPAFPDVEINLVYTHRTITVHCSKIILAHSSEVFSNMFMKDYTKTSFDLDMTKNPDHIIVPSELNRKLVNAWTNFSIYISDDTETMVMCCHREILSGITSFFDNITKSKTKIKVEHADIMASLVSSLYKITNDDISYNDSIISEKYPAWFISLEKIRYKKMLGIHVDIDELNQIIVPSAGLQTLLELSTDLEKNRIPNSFIRKISNIDLSFDSKRIVAGYQNGIVAIFNVETKMVDLTFRLNEDIDNVSFSSPNTKLCIATNKNTIRIFNITKQLILERTIQILGMIYSASFCAAANQEKIFAYGPNAIYLFDATNGERPFKFEAGRRQIECAAMCPTGRIVYFDGETVNIFDKGNFFVTQQIVPTIRINVIFLVSTNMPTEIDELVLANDDIRETWRKNNTDFIFDTFEKVKTENNTFGTMFTNSSKIIIRNKSDLDLRIGIANASNPVSNLITKIIPKKNYSFWVKNEFIN